VTVSAGFCEASAASGAGEPRVIRSHRLPLNPNAIINLHPHGHYTWTCWLGAPAVLAGPNLPTLPSLPDRRSETFAKLHHRGAAANDAKRSPTSFISTPRPLRSRSEPSCAPHAPLHLTLPLHCRKGGSALQRPLAYGNPFLSLSTELRNRRLGSLLRTAGSESLRGHEAGV